MKEKKNRVPPIERIRGVIDRIQAFVAPRIVFDVTKHITATTPQHESHRSTRKPVRRGKQGSSDKHYPLRN